MTLFDLRVVAVLSDEQVGRSPDVEFKFR